MEAYEEYSFGDNSYNTTPKTYVQGGAFLAFAKNLNVKTREISDFKLQAQVAEKKSSTYGFPLGLADGLHLDDGLFLVEFSQDSDGNEKANNIGFLRVTKSAANGNDPLVLSKAVQLYGGKGDVGSVVMEHPRLGLDTRFRLGIKSGLNVETGHAVGLIEETTESAFLLGIDFSYNLAPIVNVSQMFLDFGFTFGALNAELSEYAVDNEVVPFIWGAGLGLSKKFWFGRMNIPVGFSYGLESLSFASSEGESISFSGLSTKLNTGFEYMINANTIFNIGIEYNLVPEVTKITFLDSDGDEVNLEDFYGDDFLDYWNKGGYQYLGNDPLSLSGLAIRAGIDYSLGSSSFDLFGFLDPLKKY